MEAAARDVQAKGRLRRPGAAKADGQAMVEAAAKELEGFRGCKAF